MVQNYQVLGARALAPANINTGLAILKKSNKALNFKNFKGTAKELGEAMDTRFGSSSRYISDIGDYIDQLANNKFKVKKISKARQVGAFVEMNQKANAVATALRKGHTVDEALDLAEKAGFDYTKITPFESKVMKRLIPFYTFARKNAQLQAETFVKHPERIINQSKLANAFSNMFGGKTTEEDIKGLPNWAVEGLGFKIKEGKYLTKFGLPLEEFIQRLNKPMMSTLSSLNPIIKYPVESKLGYDFFREQKITDVNKIAPASGEMLLKAKENGLMPEWLDNALNINKYEYKGKTYYNASPKALHLLRNIPTARLENTLEKIFNKDMGKVDKYMAFFSGSKIYDIDIEMQKYFQERDLKRDIEDYLLGKGVGSKFETFNIYKNEQ
jgi:YHS domain-containing protein